MFLKGSQMGQHLHVYFCVNLKSLKQGCFLPSLVKCGLIVVNKGYSYFKERVENGQKTKDREME